MKPSPGFRTVIDAVRRGWLARRTGAWAEQFAADWLSANRGFAILTRNWRNPRDEREEIDLVCRHGAILVFVEVKAREASALVPGYFAVDRRKRRVLLSAAKAYLRRLPVKPLTFRLDVVEVALAGGMQPSTRETARRCEVRHFENVPLFPKHFRF